MLGDMKSVVQQCLMSVLRNFEEARIGNPLVAGGRGRAACMNIGVVSATSPN
jgi:hypothetical protein